MDISLSKLPKIVKDRISLACCTPWGRKESDMTERLNDNSHERKGTISLLKVMEENIE